MYEDVPVNDDTELTEVATNTPPFGEAAVDMLLPIVVANVLSANVEPDVAAASNAVTAKCDTFIVSSIVRVA